MKIFLMLLIISSCSSIEEPEEKFQKEWTGKSISVLSNHPKLSLFNKEEVVVNNNEKIIKYINTVSVESDDSLYCLPLSERINTEGISHEDINCTDSMEEESCFYKFFIKDNKVMSIEITGLSCVIECSLFPKGECN